MNLRSLLMLLMLLTVAAAGRAEPGAIEYDAPVKRGDLANAAVTESSGLAVGRINPTIAWTHNDSGHLPELFAVGPAGEDRGTFTLAGLRNRDWEDIACFRRGDEAYLLVGDVGDNNQNHTHGSLILVSEPTVGDNDPRRRVLRPGRVIHFTYEDGPGNCEAIAVDPTTDQVLLIQKVALGACGVYALPLPDDKQLDAPPDARRMQTAKRIGQLWINMVTAADISPDGRRLILATYGPAYELTRDENETWAHALKKQPRRIDLPHRRQGESICYDADGRSLLLTSEHRPTPLWHIPAKKSN